MSKKRKILIVLGSIILLIAVFIISFYYVLRINSKIVDNFLINYEEKAEKRKEEKLEKTQGEKGKAEVKRIREAREKAKNSKLKTQEDTKVIPLEIKKTRSYKKAQESINTINRIALWLRATNNSSIDDPSVKNDDLLEGIFFYMSFFSPRTFPDLQTLDADSVYYAAVEAMYDPDIRWETKYFICQVLGEREERRALPIFRNIVEDYNEAFLLRITAIDQIGTFKDKGSNGLVLKLLDDELPVMRDKATDIVCETAEAGDEQTYEQILAHYHKEEDPTVKASLLGAAITIGRERSLADIEKILETTTLNEEDAVIANITRIRTKESFEILEKLYNPQDEDRAIYIASSMAKLELDEANTFLYNVVSQANGIISVMAADDLAKYNKIEVIPYIEEALQKEQNPEFINNYKETLAQLSQFTR